VLEHDGVYVNQSPWCEPQLGKRGLYRATGGTELPNLEMALLWVLNLSDGQHGLLEIANRAHLDFGIVRHAARSLGDVGLLAPFESQTKNAPVEHAHGVTI